MTVFGSAGRDIARAFAVVGMLALSACSPIQIGSRILDFGGGGQSPAPSIPNQPILPATGASQSFGRGPVQVSLLLPLSGDPALATLGQSLANASRLAMAFIETNPNIAENITITLRDTGSTAQGASAAASAAVAAGSKLILGPLAGDQVAAAGAVARSAETPLVGFSNNAAAAGSGVYLLAVLPEMEMKRSLGWIKAQGRRGPAGVFPATPYGEAQATAFRQQAIAAGFSPQAVYTFSSPQEVQQIVGQALPLMQQGTIDALFLPDRATAPAFATALAQAGVTGNMVQIVGAADWQGDASLAGSPALAGAIHPAVDEAGLNAIRADYQARFGGQPHPMATIAYTATILANVNTLSMAPRPYDAMLMTNPSGFNGRDGVFRFLGNGRAEYALAIKQIGPGGATTLDGAKL